MSNHGKQLSIRQTMTSPTCQKMILDTLGNSKKKDRFCAAIISAVANNPKLGECDHNSIIVAGLLGETLNLSPSPQMGQYYLVPYGKKASFQIGYKGLIQLALRSGQYKKFNVVEVKDGELRSYNPFTEEIDVVAIEDPYVREATETVGYFAYFELLNGFQKSLYWTRGKMEAHRKKFSKSGTFWNDHFDAMAKKTILRQLIFKWGIISSELEIASESEDSEATVPSYPEMQVSSPPIEQPYSEPIQEVSATAEFYEQEVVNLDDI